MDGRTRRRGWQVPWLPGAAAALLSGCQLLQPTSTAEPPLAGGAQGRLVAQAQPATGGRPADPPVWPALGSARAPTPAAPAPAAAPVAPTQSPPKDEPALVSTGGIQGPWPERPPVAPVPSAQASEPQAAVDHPPASPPQPPPAPAATTTPAQPDPPGTPTAWPTQPQAQAVIDPMTIHALPPGPITQVDVEVPLSTPGIVVSHAAYPPAAVPLLPPPVNVTPTPTLAPQFQAAATPMPPGPGGEHAKSVPPGSGAILNLRPGESPLERLAEATLRLQAKEEEVRRLEARLQQVTTVLDQRGQVIGQASREVQEATEEIRRTRDALQATRKEVGDAWETLRRREKEDIEMIKKILEKLERPAGAPPSPGNGTDDHVPMQLP